VTQSIVHEPTLATALGRYTFYLRVSMANPNYAVP